MPRVTVWKIAAYIRLSRDDGGDESLSVINQRKILSEFIEGFDEPSELAGFYIDDGMTGTDHERPAFQRMLMDIENGRINCVVVKDLARAFRNYSDQGYFLETFFPARDTRFVTIGSPKIDSYLNPEAVTGFDVPITGVMNDRYCKKTSDDIRRTFDMKRRRGEFIGAFAPYGYAGVIIGAKKRRTYNGPAPFACPSPFYPSAGYPAELKVPAAPSILLHF